MQQKFKITLADATGWVMAHLNTPKDIYDICSGNGITSKMLGDIVQPGFTGITITGAVANEWLAAQGQPTLA